MTLDSDMAEVSILDLDPGARAVTCQRCQCELVRMGDGRCLECNRRKNRAFYQRNREAVLAKNRAWFKANRKHANALERARRAKKRDIINAQAKARRQAKKEEAACL